MKNICFICGINKQLFEQSADGFYNHIKRDHYLWNYIYFIYHLQIKDITDYNGYESYINNLLQTQRYDWFPVMKALSL